MRNNIIKRLAGTVLVATFAVACSDGGPEATGDVDITMQQTDAILAQVVGGWSASIVSAGASAAMVDPDTVETLAIRVTTIQLLPQGRDEEEDGSWVTLDLDERVLLDLMALPTEGESPLVIASGEVEVGTYANVRLFTDSASIRFKGPIELGVAATFEAGEDYLVEIPSGTQTGIKTNLTFTVEAEGDLNDVSLLFSSGSTFQNVTATGTGRVMLTPIIHERGEGGA